jgi:hypothetical protein
MQVIAILFLCFICFLCFIVGANGKCRSACRRRRKARAAAVQLDNVENILKTDKLSLFSRDYYFNGDRFYEAQMCPFINEHIAVNGSWPRELLSFEKKENFSREYFAKVYNASNFPLTYRNSGVYLDINDTQFEVEMRVYYNRFCKQNDDGTYGVIIAIIFATILAMMGCGKPKRR